MSQNQPIIGFLQSWLNTEFELVINTKPRSYFKAINYAVKIEIVSPFITGHHKFLYNKRDF